MQRGLHRRAECLRAGGEVDAERQNAWPRSRG